MTSSCPSCHVHPAPDERRGPAAGAGAAHRAAAARSQPHPGLAGGTGRHLQAHPGEPRSRCCSHPALAIPAGTASTGSAGEAGAVASGTPALTPGSIEAAAIRSQARQPPSRRRSCQHLDLGAGINVAVAISAYSLLLVCFQLFDH